MTGKEKKFLYVPVTSIPAQFMKKLGASGKPGRSATVMSKIFCHQVCFPIIGPSTGF